MIAYDAPQHPRLRGLVSRAFSPKVLAHIEDVIRVRARGLVTSMVSKNADGECDLVSEFAGPLPAQTICDMMGIPRQDREKVLHWTNVVLGGSDP